MNDPADAPEARAETRAADESSPPGIPRWLKVSAVVVVLLILLVLAVSFIAGIEHGPGLHGPGGEPRGDARAAAVGWNQRGNP